MGTEPRLKDGNQANLLDACRKFAKSETFLNAEQLKQLVDAAKAAANKLPVLEPGTTPSTQSQIPTQDKAKQSEDDAGERKVDDNGDAGKEAKNDAGEEKVADKQESRGKKSDAGTETKNDAG